MEEWGTLDGALRKASALVTKPAFTSSGMIVRSDSTALSMDGRSASVKVFEPGEG